MLDTTARRTRNVLTFVEKEMLADFLKDYCERDGDYAAYKPGWNDIRAAENAALYLGRPVNHLNVARLRKQLYGKLKEYPVQPAPVQTDPREENSRLRLTLLEQDKRIGVLEDRLDRLVAALGGL